MSESKDKTLLDEIERLQTRLADAVELLKQAEMLAVAVHDGDFVCRLRLFLREPQGEVQS